MYASYNKRADDVRREKDCSLKGEIKGSPVLSCDIKLRRQRK